MTSMRTVIIGAGGHGRELRNVLSACADRDQLHFQGFLDDGTRRAHGAKQTGAGVLGPTGLLEGLLAQYGDVRHYIAVGDPADRSSLSERAERLGSTPGPPLVHPGAHVGLNVRLGLGSVLFAGAVVTTNVRIGAHVHLSPNVTVSHDAILNDHVLAYPGVSVLGDAVVEAGVTLGANAVIHKGVRVGAGARIAPGAVVLEDVAPDSQSR
jgi:sugar O-acyltransferase (sialic acid O-acetyltransferase NeuD family)